MVDRRERDLLQEQDDFVREAEERGDNPYFARYNAPGPITPHASKRLVYQTFYNDELTPKEKEYYTTGHAPKYKGNTGEKITTVLENRAREGKLSMTKVNNLRYKSLKGHNAAIAKNPWSMWVKRWGHVYDKKFAEAMCDTTCKSEYIDWNRDGLASHYWKRPRNFIGSWDGSQDTINDNPRRNLPRRKIPEWPVSKRPSEDLDIHLHLERDIEHIRAAVEDQSTGHKLGGLIQRNMNENGNQVYLRQRAAVANGRDLLGYSTFTEEGGISRHGRRTLKARNAAAAASETNAPSRRVINDPPRQPEFTATTEEELEGAPDNQNIASDDEDFNNALNILAESPGKDQRNNIQEEEQKEEHTELVNKGVDDANNVKRVLYEVFTNWYRTQRSSGWVNKMATEFFEIISDVWDAEKKDIVTLRFSNEQIIEYLYHDSHPFPILSRLASSTITMSDFEDFRRNMMSILIGIYNLDVLNSKPETTQEEREDRFKRFRECILWPDIDNDSPDTIFQKLFLCNYQFSEADLNNPDFPIINLAIKKGNNSFATFWKNDIILNPFYGFTVLREPYLPTDPNTPAEKKTEFASRLSSAIMYKHLVSKMKKNPDSIIGDTATITIPFVRIGQPSEADFQAWVQLYLVREFQEDINYYFGEIAGKVEITSITRGPKTTQTELPVRLKETNLRAVTVSFTVSPKS